jgi:hypothetical protein
MTVTDALHDSLHDILHERRANVTKFIGVKTFQTKLLRKLTHAVYIRYTFHHRSHGIRDNYTKEAFMLYHSIKKRSARIFKQCVYFLTCFSLLHIDKSLSLVFIQRKLQAFYTGPMLDATLL